MEQRLWARVLRRAWIDATGTGTTDLPPDLRQRARAEVAAWVETPDFDEVCALAGYGAGRVRRRFRLILAHAPTFESASWYEGLSPEVVDEVEYTSLDRPEYLDRLRDDHNPLVRVTADLDRGLSLKEALA